MLFTFVMDVENLNDHTQSSEISSSSSLSDTDSNHHPELEDKPFKPDSPGLVKPPPVKLQSFDVASTQASKNGKGATGRPNCPTPARGVSLQTSTFSSPESKANGESALDLSKVSATAKDSGGSESLQDPSLSSEKMVQGQNTAFFGRGSVASENVAKYFAMPTINNMKVTLGIGGVANHGCSPVMSQKGRAFEGDYSCENHNAPLNHSDDEDVEIADDFEEADWSFDEEEDGVKPGKQCPCVFRSPAGSDTGTKAPLQRQDNNQDSPGTSSPLRNNPFFTSSSRILHCPDCEQTFNCLVDLNRHRLKHIKEKTFKCSHCDKSFAFSFNLKSHERQHTGERPYVCNKCGLSFGHAFDFHEHQRAHDGRGHFVCSICLKWYSQESKYLLHIRKHSSIKPFKCNMCGKSFHRAAGLRAHELLHSVRKEEQLMFPCRFCDRSFVRVAHRQMHEMIHSSEKAPPCVDCGASFKDLKALRNHVCPKQNGNNVKCNKSIGDFPSLLEVATPVKGNATSKAAPRAAQVPSTKFNTFKRKGPITSAKKRFPCKLCSRVFSNKRLLDEHGKIHQREHTPFMCKVCCLTFTHANYLKLHMTMHPDQEATPEMQASSDKAKPNGKPLPLDVCRSRQSSGDHSASPSPVSTCPPPLKIKSEPQ